MPSKSSQFHIQLDGVTLTAAQTKALAADLDRLVSDHLAKIDTKGDLAVGRPLMLNPEWLGIWIRSGGLGGIKAVPSPADIPKALGQLKQEIR
jgi:hypothetical protein